MSQKPARLCQPSERAGAGPAPRAPLLKAPLGGIGYRENELTSPEFREGIAVQVAEAGERVGREGEDWRREDTVHPRQSHVRAARCSSRAVKRAEMIAVGQYTTLRYPPLLREGYSESGLTLLSARASGSWWLSIEKGRKAPS